MRSDGWPVSSHSRSRFPRSRHKSASSRPAARARLVQSGRNPSDRGCRLELKSGRRRLGRLWRSVVRCASTATRRRASRAGGRGAERVRSTRVARRQISVGAPRVGGRGAERARSTRVGARVSRRQRREGRASPPGCAAEREAGQSLRAAARAVERRRALRQRQSAAASAWAQALGEGAGTHKF